MRKKLLAFFMLLILCFFTGCIDFIEDMYYSDERKISVIVNSVDNSMLHGKYVCEWGDSYAYYDQNIIYYYADKNSEPYEIEFLQLEYMNMNERYIYCAGGERLRVFDKESKQSTELSVKGDENDKKGNVVGINIYGDEVIVLYKYSYGDAIYYEIEGNRIINKNVYDYNGVYDGACINEFNYFYIFAFSNDQLYRIEGSGVQLIDENGNKGEYYSFGQKGGVADTSPEHISKYNGKLYILLQFSPNSTGRPLNNKYHFKDRDELAYFDLENHSSESLYITSGAEEQIVSFSVENDEMYLLIKGKLYKSTLTGENKTELADLKGISRELSFEYVNDTLFVYNQDVLIGQYK